MSATAVIPMSRGARTTTPTPGGLTMATADDKLDRALTALTDLRVGQERLDGKVSASLARHDRTEARLDDHELRLRDGEQWRWRQIGYGASAGGAVGIVSTLIGYILTH